MKLSKLNGPKIFLRLNRKKLDLFHQNIQNSGKRLESTLLNTEDSAKIDKIICI